MKTIIKPWGKEEWLELNDKYCYKRIYINAGYKTSFQYHKFKRETNYIISGTAEVWLENKDGEIEKKIMKAGEYFNVSPPQKHRVIAITDIILQEVSTPEVDDVFRIEDDANRKDGKIDGEHQTPAVLILAAGLGSRLKHLTKDKNKALIPINNKAIISYIIEKFPIEYDIVVAVGHEKKSLIEYCELAHSDRKFKFVEVDKWENPQTGPGYSALKCKEFLQRPFYITTVDCVIDAPLPFLDGDWLGVYETGIPEKYSTVKFDENKKVLNLKNKSACGHDHAFIGLAAVWNYDIFWKELETNGKNTELISAWDIPTNYPNLKAKEIKWFDSGNLDDIQALRDHYKDNPLSLYKNTGETTYKIGNKFLKFNSNLEINKNRFLSGKRLNELAPNNLIQKDYFIQYDWENGQTLYSYNSKKEFEKFLHFLIGKIDSSITWKNEYLMRLFYEGKTDERISSFISKYGYFYKSQSFVINGRPCKSLAEILLSKPFKNKMDSLLENEMYLSFHGDLQFDNIIYNQKEYKYIDWRESFAGKTMGGDIFYDLAKLYGGTLMPYNILKNKNAFRLVSGHDTVFYSYDISEALVEFRSVIESVLNSHFDFEKIKFITALIYLNMSPLHDDVLNKILWFKGIEMLNEQIYK